MMSSSFEVGAVEIVANKADVIDLDQAGERGSETIRAALST
jgi:hypothetical protein